jgi:hypothetical protein
MAVFFLASDLKQEMFQFPVVPGEIKRNDLLLKGLEILHKEVLGMCL